MVNTRYKHTVMGLIPDDWNISTFGEVLTGFSSGMTPYRGNPEFYNGNIPWVTSGELNYNVIADTLEKITEEAVSSTNLKILPKGTFLMAITGLEAAGTRGSCALLGVDATTNQSCLSLFSTLKLTTKYLYYFYLKFGENYALKYAQGTKQQSFTGKIVKKFPIIFPPTREEQNAIVKALSDTDDLIMNLIKLIKKKKNIKKGAMTSLFNFKENWRYVNFGDLMETLTDYDANGSFISVAENVKVSNGNGFAWYVRSTDLEKKSDLSEVKYIDEFSYKFLKKTPLFGGELLILKRGDIGKVYLFKRRTDYASLAPNLYLIKVNKESDPTYLYYYLLTNEGQNKLKAINASSTLGALYKDDVKSVKIPIPKDIDEQIRIGSILSDIDKEIESLEKQLSKVKKLKEGMMQKLLTGKTRLIEPKHNYTSIEPEIVIATEPDQIFNK